MDEGTRIRNGERVKITFNTVDKLQSSLANLPKLIDQILEQEMYREFVIAGTVYSNDSFAEFVTSNPPQGLGMDLKTLRALYRFAKAQRGGD